MRTALIAIAVAALLAGCGRITRPVPAQCNEICLLPCTVNGDAGVRWEADPNNAEAWDELGGEVVPTLIGKLQTCEVRRGACVQCLQRLDKAGIIHLK
ncbi:TPA: hypothetical protein UN285_000412 [Stenotrophomonas maltophilia]|jgi:hypothetical protein|uniref:Lipoprotein n=1 Tax=Stenotrophomonas maltophilia TaxID=40324 RepID=A0ABD7C088_STEMA|nr:hypothetical protein [Stenotrophomonas maltophilia]EKU9979165.1 hypothetical protein [Stenotrophomonas maltophilia]EKX6271035.1 hypothetical protein [Stenotrophomonas maltophilia]MBS6054028.1 hypothetical protein [Stenotrophomonas maltophilia]MCU1145785.1 hypothetical protein [Stenotrophomonas maltophilia]MDG9766155.1 hypothetical protein [Stenotrophomonas maltophilia]